MLGTKRLGNFPVWPEPKSGDVRYLIATGGKADEAQIGQNRVHEPLRTFAENEMPLQSLVSQRSPLLASSIPAS